MIAFPDKKYSIIYADPPWKYASRMIRGNAEDHYNVMTLDDICRLPVGDLAADDCVLFMWATYPKAGTATSSGSEGGQGEIQSRA